VTIERVENYWSEHPLKQEDENIVVQMTARYLQLALGEGDCMPTRHHKTTTGPLFTQSDISKAHGVAIWAWSAEVGSQVSCHLDYAEQICYESNVIVPPLLAGTPQCTQSKLEGGDFMVSFQGIQHYQMHG
jgi:hypothetical protein